MPPHISLSRPARLAESARSERRLSAKMGSGGPARRLAQSISRGRHACRQNRTRSTIPRQSPRRELDHDAVEIAFRHAAVERGVGVIVKRPLANCLWRIAERPAFIHSQAYWDRLGRLQYDFLRGDRAVETALRFVLTIPGVHTALIGTTNPAHLIRNAESADPLDEQAFRSIRNRWKEVSSPDWREQV